MEEEKKPHLHATGKLLDAPTAALHAVPANADAKDVAWSIARRRTPCSCLAKGGHAWIMVWATVPFPCSELPDTRCWFGGRTDHVGTADAAALP